MKRIITLFLTAGMLLGAATAANAIDFSAKGRWEMFFTGGNPSFMSQNRSTNKGIDSFQAAQRLRLQMDAVASESLSGTVLFEIGTTAWGQGASGGALGTDGKNVEVKRAYLDWVVPNTDLSFRMGLMGVTLPNAAGGSTVLDDDAAGIQASWKINENVSLGALWVRPYNDNYSPSDKYSYEKGPANFLDNVDLFVLSLPVNFQGVSTTPWVGVGIDGKNNFNADNTVGSSGNAGSRFFYHLGMLPRDLFSNRNQADNNKMHFTRDYNTTFWAGLPIKVATFDPFNIEFDLNYGSSQGWGTYTDSQGRRADTKREGWVAKALVEYAMDWGTPGLFGWYGSGDDGNNRNGSEMLPVMSAMPTFSSFGMGSYMVEYHDYNLTGEVALRSYAGTWGIGAQLKDLSFLENLKHTVRVLYYGGTNDPAMAKVLGPNGWNNMAASYDGVGWGVYLTRNDYLVEFNLDNTWKIYDNLEMAVELAYIINGVDKDTWKWQGNMKGDAWKTGVSFIYNF